MKRVYLLIDCGTTNLRVTLLDEGMKVLDCEKAAGGVRHTAIDGHNGRLKTMLGECISAVLSRNGFSYESVEKCAAYGMITSNMGLLEIPHLFAPASKDDLKRAVKAEVFPEIAPFPIFFIPGVKCVQAEKADTDYSSADMMRGEETEAIGLYELLELKEKCIFVLPGSHNKFVYMNENGAIVSSMTSVSGELLDAVTHHTILADSVGRSFLTDDEYSRDLIVMGAKECAEYGLGKAVFTGRILNTLGKKDASAIRSYLMGAVLQADCEAMKAFMKKTGNAKVFIAGKAPLQRALFDCMIASGIDNVETVGEGIGSRMGYAGAKAIVF